MNKALVVLSGGLDSTTSLRLALEEYDEGKVSGHIGAGKITEQAIERGFNVSARVHNYLWSNVVGK